jgi:hypothetical protein
MKDTLSETAYLKKGNVRKLPIYKCWVTSTYKEHGIANVVVSRKHKNGNISAAFYLVDLYCLGIKDSLFFFNLFENEFIENVVSRDDDLEEVSYEFAHNLIYGAEVFAAENGLTPHKSFKETQMVLEEDTEAIELVYFEFGMDGKPHLIINPNENRNKELRILENTLGPDGFTFVKVDSSDLEDDEDDQDYEEKMEMLKHLNDNDEIYCFDFDDLELMNEIAQFNDEELFEKNPDILGKTLAKHIGSAPNAINLSIDAFYLNIHPEFKKQVKETRCILPTSFNKDETIFHYLSDYELIEHDLELLLDEGKEMDEALEIIAVRYEDNVNVYTFLNDYFDSDDEIEKRFVNALAFYDRFPDLLFSKAGLLLVSYLSSDPEESLKVTFEKLPFKVEASLNFHETNPIGKEYHVAEVSAFLFINGMAFAAEGKILETEKCLSELAKFKPKRHDFFFSLRNSLTRVKEIQLELSTNQEGIFVK